MQLGAVTYNVLKDMDLDTVIKTLEGAGFESVELRTGHKHGVEPGISEAERARVKARFERSKVKLLSYGTTCEFQSADPAERQKQVETAKQFVTHTLSRLLRIAQISEHALMLKCVDELYFAVLTNADARLRSFDIPAADTLPRFYSVHRCNPAFVTPSGIDIQPL